MGTLRPKTAILGLATAALALAVLTTLLSFSGSIAAGWNDHFWTRLPRPVALLLSNTALWWVVLALTIVIVLLVRKIHTTAKEGAVGGAPVGAMVLGGGGRATWRKLQRRLPPVLRNALHMVGVFPDDRRLDAVEPIASKLNPAADFVEVPPGQSNQQAALAAHENYAPVYKPVLRRGLDRTGRVLAILHQGGYTGTVASIYACQELAANPKESVVLFMGDSPDPLVAAIHDPYLYEKARRARAQEESVKYAWTRGEPEVVEVPA